MSIVTAKRRAFAAGASLLGVLSSTGAQSSTDATRRPDQAGIPQTPEDQGWFTAIPGERMRVRLHSDLLDGRATMLESIAMPGIGAPLHTHREDELFQIREGVMTFKIADRRFEAREGEVLAVPRGVAHRWSNFGDRPARYLATFAPGGIEAMFQQISSVPPAELAAFAMRFGTVVLGPPLQR